MKYFVENKVTIFKLFLLKYKIVYYIFSQQNEFCIVKVQPLISLVILIFYSRLSPYFLFFLLRLINRF